MTAVVCLTDGAVDEVVVFNSHKSAHAFADEIKEHVGSVWDAIKVIPVSMPDDLKEFLETEVLKKFIEEEREKARGKG